MSVRRPQHLTRRKSLRSLIVTEGNTEKWYFDSVLDKKYCEIKNLGNAKSNPLKMVSEAKKRFLDNNNRNYQKIYCVFDRDHNSNTIEQLQKIEKVFKSTDGKLERIFSNPCMEVNFCFHFNDSVPICENGKEVLNALNKFIQRDNKQNCKYEKTEQCIKQIVKLTSFITICRNTEKAFKRLAINDKNWFNEENSYSEIFKLAKFSIK